MPGLARILAVDAVTGNQRLTGLVGWLKSHVAEHGIFARPVLRIGTLVIRGILEGNFVAGSQRMRAIGTADDILEAILDRVGLDTQQMVPYHFDATTGDWKGKTANTAAYCIPAFPDTAVERILGNTFVDDLWSGAGTVGRIYRKPEAVGIFLQQCLGPSGKQTGILRHIPRGYLEQRFFIGE
ncbi:hypothetical protein D3C84_731930 [compost metagenome]